MGEGDDAANDERSYDKDHLGEQPGDREQGPSAIEVVVGCEDFLRDR
jgi:hypothetical protein